MTEGDEEALLDNREADIAIMEQVMLGFNPLVRAGRENAAMVHDLPNRRERRGARRNNVVAVEDNNLEF